MKNLISALLLTFSISAFAGIESSDLSLSGLNEAQRAKIALAIAEMKEVPKNAVEVPDVDKLKQWADLGTGIGQGLAAAAKELGVAADEFSKTTVGKITIGLIIWKVAGQDVSNFASEVIGIIFGVLWLLAVIPLWLIFYRRHNYEPVQVKSGEGDKVKYKVKYKYDQHQCPEGTQIVTWVALIVIAMIGIIPIFA